MMSVTGTQNQTPAHSSNGNQLLLSELQHQPQKEEAAKKKNKNWLEPGRPKTGKDLVSSTSGTSLYLIVNISIC